LRQDKTLPFTEASNLEQRKVQYSRECTYGFRYLVTPVTHHISFSQQNHQTLEACGICEAP
jgi:hypothetical protein